jgi:predicted  nucleic acid-binding Zn-ribbon protein
MNYEVGTRLDRIEAKTQQILDRQVEILALFSRVAEGVLVMSQELDTLTQQVKQNSDAEQSAITLLTKLSDLIKQNATDPAALNKLAADLKGSADQLAAAVVANTPAQPGPTP